MRRTCVKKATEKSGFWLETFPCVSGQTLKQGSNHFTIGQTRISGFGLKCTGCSDLELGGNLRFFTSVSGSVTLVKKREGVFSGSRHPESFSPNPQTRVAPFNGQRNPCLRVWPETFSIPLIQISLSQKGSGSLQNAPLIGILRITGREAVFWKACDELCHVVGSEKTRMRRTCVKKATEKSGFWLETFQAKP